jgi:hypothetical protein
MDLVQFYGTLVFDGLFKIVRPAQEFCTFMYLIFSALLPSSHFFFSEFQVFGLSTTDKTSLVQMLIWCIKIGIVLVLHFNPWVEASAGGLLLPEGL